MRFGGKIYADADAARCASSRRTAKQCRSGSAARRRRSRTRSLILATAYISVSTNNALPRLYGWDWVGGQHTEEYAYHHRSAQRRSLPSSDFSAGPWAVGRGTRVPVSTWVGMQRFRSLLHQRGCSFCVATTDHISSSRAKACGSWGADSPNR
jgi:hypothetical protein